MLLVCTRMYSCVTHMYSYVLVCYSYVLVCYSYVTRMYSCGVLVTIAYNTIIFTLFTFCDNHNKTDTIIHIGLCVSAIVRLYLHFDNMARTKYFI